MTAAELAECLGVRQPMISRIENGQRGKRYDFLPRLARALGCRIDDLFPEMDEVSETPAEQQTPATAPVVEPTQESEDWAGMDLS